MPLELDDLVEQIAARAGSVVTREQRRPRLFPVGGVMEMPVGDEEETQKGGKGSGFHGHKGRPGEIGGSAPEAGIGLGSGEDAIAQYAKATGMSAAQVRQMLASAEEAVARFTGPKVVSATDAEASGVALGEKHPGECYSTAAEYLMNHSWGIRGGDEVPGLKLVHGVVSNNEGLRIGHAWVLVPGNKVFDGTQSQFYDKDSYYKAGKAVEEHVYTWPQAKKWLATSHHYGPWEGTAGITKA
jgi:hypothetical protein